MAKKGNRIVILFKCSKCKSTNYSSTINRVNQKEKKLTLKKYCKKCRKHTLHEMTKI